MQDGGPRGELLSIRLLSLPEVNLGRRSYRFARKKGLALLFDQTAEGEKRSAGSLPTSCGKELEASRPYGPVQYPDQP